MRILSIHRVLVLFVFSPLVASSCPWHDILLHEALQGLSLVQMQVEPSGLDEGAPRKGRMTRRNVTAPAWPASYTRLPQTRSPKVLPPDFSSKVASINTTYDDVDRVVTSVNSTIGKVEDLVVSNLDALITALQALKILADSLKPVMGEQLVDWLNSFVVSMQRRVDSISGHEQEFEAQTQKSLKAVLADFVELRERVASAYGKAGERIDELSDQCVADQQSTDSVNASMLQMLKSQGASYQAQAWNPLDWFKNLFGGRKKSPCHESEELVRKANGTANEVAVKLDELNNTINVLFIELDEGIASGIESIRSIYTGALEKSSGVVTSTVKEQLDEALDSVFDLAESAVPATYARDLYKQMSDAKADMLPLYEASQLLLDSAAPCCSPSGSK